MREVHTYREKYTLRVLGIQRYELRMELRVVYHNLSYKKKNLWMPILLPIQGRPTYRINYATLTIIWSKIQPMLLRTYKFHCIFSFTTHILLHLFVFLLCTKEGHKCSAHPHLRWGPLRAQLPR